MIARLLRRLLLGSVLALLALALLLKLRYGGGADFPDRSGPPRLTPAVLEVVAELPTPPGNVSVSAGGRILLSLHPEARPAIQVAEWRDGALQPFPDAGWQRCGRDRGDACFNEVLGLRVDDQNRLWVLDTGHHGWVAPRLLGFDLDSGALLRTISFPREQAPLGSHLNDFQITRDGRHALIADASFFGQRPALLVVDLEQGHSRRLLEGHPAVTAQPYTPVVQGRRMEVFGLVSIRPGVDSIALDPAGEWLYFAPISNLELSRLRVSDLLDPTLEARTLAGRVQTVAAKTMSDGITVDSAGHVYLSDLEHSAIVLLHPDGRLETLVQDERLLRWPDGFSFGPDGWLYVTASSLHQVIGRLPGQVREQGPYHLLRLRAPAAGRPGH
ncbi:MAG TPA: L-dopachrome tautomerase-related protein [Nevskiaceae bacterium]|nr:L-dopachrome tautomerase-related protein [Nevskiaceae bacterium]